MLKVGAALPGICAPTEGPAPEDCDEAPAEDAGTGKTVERTDPDVVPVVAAGTFDKGSLFATVCAEPVAVTEAAAGWSCEPLAVVVAGKPKVLRDWLEAWEVVFAAPAVSEFAAGRRIASAVRAMTTATRTRRYGLKGTFLFFMRQN